MPLFTLYKIILIFLSSERLTQEPLQSNNWISELNSKSGSINESFIRVDFFKIGSSDSDWMITHKLDWFVDLKFKLRAH